MLPVLIISLLIPLSVGALAGALTMGSMAQYAALAQPPLSPPGWVFPAVWTVLYLLMGLACYLIWASEAPQAEKKRALTLYGAQLVLNFIWPLLFFEAGEFGVALIWLALLTALVLATAAAFGHISKTAAWLLAPYLLWLVFAAYLTAGVWLLNG